MRLVGIICLGLLMCSCGAEVEGEVSTEMTDSTVIENAGPDSVEQGTNVDFNELYDQKLSQTCNCDLDVYFELDGEGESFPLKVHLDGEIEEHMVSEGHVYAYDPIQNRYFLDLLADGTTFAVGDSAYCLWQQSSAITHIVAGPVFEWPDMLSYVNFDLQTTSNWSIFGCYENWVKVRQWNDGASEYTYGWIQVSAEH